MGENECEQRIFTTREKIALILKTTLAIFNKQIIEENYFLIKQF